MRKLTGCKSNLIIATGGFARMIAKESHTIDKVDHFLTLSGLQVLYERNEEKHRERNERCAEKAQGEKNA